MAKAKKTAPKASKSAPKVAAKPAVKASKPVAKAPTAAPAKPVAARPNIKVRGVERLEIPAPDFQEWWDNLKAYAYKSPAALVVGIIAVWMALVLLFD